MIEVQIRRGSLIRRRITRTETLRYFKRYEVTEDGISPRVLPGKKNGLHHVTGVEHDETGRPSEARKSEMIDGQTFPEVSECYGFNTPVKMDAKHDEADLLISWF